MGPAALERDDVWASVGGGLGRQSEQLRGAAAGRRGVKEPGDGAGCGVGLEVEEGEPAADGVEVLAEAQEVELGVGRAVAEQAVAVAEEDGLEVELYRDRFARSAFDCAAAAAFPCSSSATSSSRPIMSGAMRFMSPTERSGSMSPSSSFSSKGSMPA